MGMQHDPSLIQVDSRQTLTHKGQRQLEETEGLGTLSLGLLHVCFQRVLVADACKHLPGGRPDQLALTGAASATRLTESAHVCAGRNLWVAIWKEQHCMSLLIRG